VKLRAVESPITIFDAANALLMTGGATTVILADAISPFPPSMDVMALVVFVLGPATFPVTLIVKTQFAAAPSAAPDRLMLLDPAVATMNPPPQVPSPTVPFGLPILKVKPVLWFNGTVGPENDFAMVGGATIVKPVDVLLAW
jgi:hypothetical protein